jgi:hypothetical protein
MDEVYVQGVSIDCFFNVIGTSHVHLIPAGMQNILISISLLRAVKGKSFFQCHLNSTDCNLYFKSSMQAEILKCFLFEACCKILRIVK